MKNDDANPSDNQTLTEPPPEVRYVLLLSFATVNEVERTVLLRGREGEILHKDPNSLLSFDDKFRPGQVFDSELGDGTPIHLINILASFTKNQFDVNQANIPSLGSWDDAEKPTIPTMARMNPIKEPPPVVRPT